MDKILYKKELLGIRIRKPAKGVHPISGEHDALQVLTLNHPKGHKVLPHKHKPTKRETGVLQECIVVLSGKVRMDLYGTGNTVLKRVTLKAGEAFITLSGGHALTFLEPSQIIETKNGPFISDRVNLS